MNEHLHTLDLSHLSAVTADIVEGSVSALESGKVIYCPHYAFIPQITEQGLLSETVLHPKHKNISYDYRKAKLSGLCPSTPVLAEPMMAFMHRFAEYAEQLVKTLLPAYQQDLVWGRTSYRPAEIKNRTISKRKDDTRLHVDSFPATPVNGLRILRVFANINPYGAHRTWEMGESFPQVLSRFSKKIPAYSGAKARLLQWFKMTKSLRSPYDHFMLNLHDQMKLDDHYQSTVKKQRFGFPAKSTWIVFTDTVSHAALSGQYLLEQTFYLPVSAMKNPELSPLKQWSTTTSR